MTVELSGVSCNPAMPSIHAGMTDFGSLNAQSAKHSRALLADCMPFAIMNGETYGLIDTAVQRSWTRSLFS